MIEQQAPPPPKINFQSLLNRNVPSIDANLIKLRREMNLRSLNQILQKTAQKEATSSQTSLVDQSLNSGDSQDLSVHNLLYEDEEIANHSKSDGQSAILRRIKDCPDVPTNLEGPLHPELNRTEFFTEELVEELNADVDSGGHWAPTSCISRHRVAIVIPYRDRGDHLAILLAHLHPILQRQLLDYRIYLVEQAGNQTFNKARIMNIAFVTALKEQPIYDCFVFHDVDLVPEDDRNMYSCPPQPRHMSVGIDEMNYQIPYEELVGGVLAIRTEHFFKVNGYSNLYWGWGAEDDDMAYRIQHVGLKIIRPPPQIARYKMIRHRKRNAVDARIRYRLLFTGVRRYKIDGLNSLESLNYTIASVRRKKLYTHILVDIGPPPEGF